MTSSSCTDARCPSARGLAGVGCLSREVPVRGRRRWWPTRHEAFDLASVLVRADRPEPREREVTPVVFKAHGPGRERAAVPVLAALFVAARADPTAGDRARTRALPAP